MNYALDALWWKLTHPDVRALAAILTAPPLWHSGAELPVRTLLGETGFRYLLALDQNPVPLETHLAAEAPFGHRLGRYAESLLAFWFSHAPHSRLHARNLTVCDAHNQTLGAADFIVSLNTVPYHIELTCKYYGSTAGTPDTLRGLNPDDTLAAKSAKLQTQLALMHTSDGLRALQPLNLPHNPQPASIVRGTAFFSDGHTRFTEPLNPYGWHGLYLQHRADYTPPVPAARCCKLPRTAYLAPARVPESETLPLEALHDISDGLIAILEPRPDGFWHEIQRIMKAV